MPFEELVLVTAWAISALDAADEQDCDAEGHQYRQHVRIQSNKVGKYAHKPQNHAPL